MEEPKTVRILHAADIHLDSPFSRLSPEEGAARRRELREAFARLTALLRDGDVDVALLAGDLFDREFVTPATVELLVREFAACPHCRVVISPGNHDPYLPGGLYASGKLPANVYVFRDEALSSFAFPEIGVVVHGFAFHGDRHEAAPLAGARAEADGALHLLCLHGDVGAPLSKYAPISEGDLASFGAAYAALGHRHVAGAPKEVGTCRYAYAGCLVGRSFDEPGKGGAWLLSATRGEDGAWRLSPSEKVTLADRQYATLPVDLTGAEQADEAEERVRAAVAASGYGQDTCLRVVAEGAVAPGLSLLSLPDAAALGLFSVEYSDRTTPTYGAAFLEKDLSVRGELYRALLPALTSGTAEERAVAARALRMGLSALAGGDVE